MEKASLFFLPYSRAIRSMRREPRPEPVPPPKEWKTMKPWRAWHCSAILRSLSMATSICSLPAV